MNGCRRSSVQPRDQITSSPNTLLSNYVWIVTYRKGENKRKEAEIAPFLRFYDKSLFPNKSALLLFHLTVTFLTYKMNYLPKYFSVINSSIWLNILVRSTDSKVWFLLIFNNLWARSSKWITVLFKALFLIPTVQTDHLGSWYSSSVSNYKVVCLTAKCPNFNRIEPSP